MGTFPLAPGLRSGFPTRSPGFRARVVWTLLLLWWWSAVSIPAQAGDQQKYDFPPIIGLAIAPPGADFAQTGSLQAVIESRLGTVRDLEIRFQASPDLAIEAGSAPLTLPRLGPGEKRLLPIRCRPASGTADELGSWVRLGVTYTPDHALILKSVANPASYPNEAERQRLIDITVTNLRASERHAEAVRIFLPTVTRRAP